MPNYNWTKIDFIPHICHFFTHAKFLENKIYTEIYTVNCQFTQLIANLHSKLPIFRVKSVEIYTGQKKFTRAPPVAPVTNMRYVCGFWCYSSTNQLVPLLVLVELEVRISGTQTVWSSLVTPFTCLASSSHGWRVLAIFLTIFMPGTLHRAWGGTLFLKLKWIQLHCLYRT